ncbi:MAG: transcription-repair coupling factor [Clostridiales bacterium]|jgi:transcription-repair coupling factor (superfamily II helicase)|nr:transcription-repair coupling factor [Clostridiales bacterium]
MIEKGGREGFHRIEHIAKSATGIVNISGISDSRSAKIAGVVAEARGGQVLLIASSYARAKRLAEDLPFFVGKRVILLPEEEQFRITYDAKSHDLLLDRLSALIPLVKGEECIVVTSALGAVKKLAPKSLFIEHSITLSLEDSKDMEQLKRQLTYMGYERVGSVEAKGQYSIRGGILDVFPPDKDYPCRVEFFDIEVDSIRFFDPVTQRSISSLNTIEIFPAELIVQSEHLFEQAATRIKSHYEKFMKKLPIEKKERLKDRMGRVLEYIETRTNIQLLENYIHYFYERPERVWDYMKDDGLIIVDDPERVMDTLELSETEYREDFKVFLERGEAAPDDFGAFSGQDDFFKIYERGPILLFTPFQKQIKGVDRLDAIINIVSKQATVFSGRMDFLEAELSRYANQGYNITISCSTKDRVENMQHFVRKCRLQEKVSVKHGALSSGMEFPEEKLVIFSDNDIFVKAKRKTKKKKDKRHIIKSFTDIRSGDYVVHENHGVGKFIGVIQMEIQGIRKDYLKIKYAGEDLLYVPVEQMDLIQKYVGVEGSVPKVNKLSGGDWKKTKARAKSAIKDMAKDLIELSAARQAERGHSFSKDSIWQREFEDLFPYEETADQLRCVEEIKKDMEKPVPMDRLLCGDVGYGKTEVAARAIFKCVTDSKQAAVLVPTTLLANQHYHTFKERFADFPISVEMLSRFRTDKQQKGIINKLKKGELDIVIGTHRLLSDDVSFHDLGLLVIDEEQHFGVQHKEKIKKLRKNVDVLTLSATPIPRTLHMSLVGIRDMSLIEEPPEERYPVQTYVMEQDDNVLKEAIERELDRGGQVYVVFNRVRGIQKIASHIRDLVPEARVSVAHGQMNERQLEDIMIEFVNDNIDILVATTIIESGLDIPNANTLIILDADRYGLAQLYQLRGRVGRSNRMAYAYLMYQKDKVLTEVAEKRLRAIREFTEFGAGFHIAMRDLEIRGAGNILGTEQHGHMMMIGYELYCKLVDDAVRELTGKKTDRLADEETSVEIQVEAYISSSYIEDELIKLEMYKKIASIKDESDKSEVIDELLDRFGDIPKETLNLIDIALIKALASKVGILRIHQEQQKLVFSFNEDNGLKADMISKIVEKYGNNILVHGGIRPFIKLSLMGKNRLFETISFLTNMVQESIMVE